MHPQRDQPPVPHPDVVAADPEHQLGGGGADREAVEAGRAEGVAEFVEYGVVVVGHTETGVPDQQGGLPDGFGHQHRVVVPVAGQPVEAVQPGPLGAQQEVVRTGGLPAGDEYFGDGGAVDQLAGDGPFVEVVAARARLAGAGVGIRSVAVHRGEHWHDWPHSRVSVGRPYWRPAQNIQATRFLLPPRGSRRRAPGGFTVPAFRPAVTPWAARPGPWAGVGPLWTAGAGQGLD